MSQTKLLFNQTKISFQSILFDRGRSYIIESPSHFQILWFCPESHQGLLATVSVIDNSLSSSISLMWPFWILHSVRRCGSSLSSHSVSSITSGVFQCSELFQGSGQPASAGVTAQRRCRPHRECQTWPIGSSEISMDICVCFEHCQIPTWQFDNAKNDRYFGWFLHCPGWNVTGRDSTMKSRLCRQSPKLDIHIRQNRLKSRSR
jgi:hypothetical protein